MSRYDCEVCGKTPNQSAIHRVSPKGGEFVGRCSSCLGVDRPNATMADRILDAMEPVERTKPS